MVTNIKETIRKWLADTDMNPTEKPDQSANFHFIINFPQGSDSHLDIIQPKGKSDLVLIHGGVGLDPTQISHFAGLQPQQRDAFMREFMILLASQPVDVNIPHDKGILQTFIISDVIVGDGLTKERIIAAIRTVNRVRMLGILRVDQEIGGPIKGKGSDATDSRMFG